MAFRSASPLELLDALRIREPEQIDLTVIAAFCGAMINLEPLEGCDSRILGRGDHAYITVRRDMPMARQRFSIAHEIGHWMLHRQQPAFKCTMAIGYAAFNIAEGEADEFAAGLLMPRPHFCSEMSGLRVRWRSVAVLKKIYGTSLAATAIRFVQCCSLPAMLVCYGPDGQRRWFKRGEQVPEDVFPLRRLAPETGAAELRVTTLKCKRIGAVLEASTWLESPRKLDFTVLEDSTRYGDDTLSLLSWNQPGVA